MCYFRVFTKVLSHSMIIFAFLKGVYTLKYKCFRLPSYPTETHVEMVVPVSCSGTHSCSWCKRRLSEPVKRVDPPSRIPGMHLITYSITEDRPIHDTVDKHWTNPHNKYHYRVAMQGDDKLAVKSMNDLCSTFPIKKYRFPTYNLIKRLTCRSYWCIGIYLNTRMEEAQTREWWICSEMCSYMLALCGGLELLRGRHPCNTIPGDLFRVLPPATENCSTSICTPALREWKKARDPANIFMQISLEMWQSGMELEKK